MNEPLVETIAPAALRTALQRRYAVKKFDPARRIPEATWSALEDALVLTPSSFGLQPWRFIVVTDSARKAALAAASWGQPQPRDASHHVVFAVQHELGPADVERWVARLAAVRGAAPAALEGYRRVMLDFVAKPGFDARAWAACQAYIALGNFLTSAALLGVDACPMEGIQKAEYDAILGLAEQGCTAVVACAAGYRAADDAYARQAKARYPKDDVVLHF